MSVRMKLTHSKTGSRRAHHGASPLRLTKDTKTGNTHIRHFVDQETGMYRGKQILAKKADKAVAPATKKAAAKKEAAQEEKETAAK